MNSKDIHAVIIGYDATILQYRINLEILRFNFKKSQDFWITTVFNGNEDLLPSGIGENTFIKLKEDRGYAYGALDAINTGLTFAANSHRQVVALFNFDCLWFDEEKFEKAIDNFVGSGKVMAAAKDVNGLLATDCMFFRRSFLKKILPITPEYAKYREGLEIADRYKDTELGFNNVEEWLWETIYKFLLSNMTNPETELKEPEVRDSIVREYVNGLWHKLERTDLPRLRWSDEMAFGHLHDKEEIKQKLIDYNIRNGYVITSLLEGKL